MLLRFLNLCSVYRVYVDERTEMGRQKPKRKVMSSTELKIKAGAAGPEIRVRSAFQGFSFPSLSPSFVATPKRCLEDISLIQQHRH